MWRDFERWLDGQIGKNGLVKTIFLPVMGVLAILGAGLRFDQDILVVVAGFVALFVVLSFNLYLVARLRLTQRRLSNTRKQVTVLVQGLVKVNPQSHVMQKWVETQSIGRDGDTRIQRDITVRLEQGTLHFFLVGAWQHRDTRITSREKREVKASVDWLDLASGETRHRCVTTTRGWQEINGGVKHEVLAFLPEPLAAPATFRLGVNWRWPGCTTSLLGADSELFDWNFRVPTEELVVTVEIEDVVRQGRNPYVLGHNGGPDPTITERGSVLACEARYERLRADVDTVGFKLQFGGPITP